MKRNDFKVTISDDALEHLLDIAETKNMEDYFLRINFTSRGYSLVFDKQLSTTDSITHVAGRDGMIFTIVTEFMTLELVDGVIIDINPEGEGFMAHNPNINMPGAI